MNIRQLYQRVRGNFTTRCALVLLPYMVMAGLIAINSYIFSKGHDYYWEWTRIYQYMVTGVILVCCGLVVINVICRPTERYRGTGIKDLSMPVVLIGAYLMFCSCVGCLYYVFYDLLFMSCPEALRVSADMNIPRVVLSDTVYNGALIIFFVSAYFNVLHRCKVRILSHDCQAETYHHWFLATCTVVFAKVIFEEVLEFLYHAHHHHVSFENCTSLTEEHEDWLKFHEDLFEPLIYLMIAEYLPLLLGLVWLIPHIGPHDEEPTTNAQWLRSIINRCIPAGLGGGESVRPRSSSFIVEHRPDPSEYDKTQRRCSSFRESVSKDSKGSAPMLALPPKKYSEPSKMLPLNLKVENLLKLQFNASSSATVVFSVGEDHDKKRNPSRRSQYREDSTSSAAPMIHSFTSEDTAEDFMAYYDNQVTLTDDEHTQSEGESLEDIIGSDVDAEGENGSDVEHQISTINTLPSSIVGGYSKARVKKQKGIRDPRHKIQIPKAQRARYDSLPPSFDEAMALPTTSRLPHKLTTILPKKLSVDSHPSMLRRSSTLANILHDFDLAARRQKLTALAHELQRQAVRRFKRLSLLCFLLALFMVVLEMGRLYSLLVYLLEFNFKNFEMMIHGYFCAIAMAVLASFFFMLVRNWTTSAGEVSHMPHHPHDLHHAHESIGIRLLMGATGLVIVFFVCSAVAGFFNSKSAYGNMPLELTILVIVGQIPNITTACFQAVALKKAIIQQGLDAGKKDAGKLTDNAWIVIGSAAVGFNLFEWMITFISRRFNGKFLEHYDFHGMMAVEVMFPAATFYYFHCMVCWVMIVFEHVKSSLHGDSAESMADLHNDSRIE